MKKIVLTYGLIAGLIVSIWMFATISISDAITQSDLGMYLGFTAMLVAFAFIFVGIKNYRDKYNGGWITFGSGFKIGLYISLIASTMYVVSWLIDFYFFIPDFMDKYMAASIEKLKAAGASAAEIQEQADFAALYKNNPLVCALFTYVEILPLGLVVSVIAALILKRKQEHAGGINIS